MATLSELDHTVTDYQLQHAYWLAKAAKLAYAEEPTIRETTMEWGFDRCEYFHGELDASFPISDTQGFAAGSERMIIVAFRGTEPKKIKDWLTDTNTLAAPGPAGNGFVHFGFSRALDSVFPQVRDAVERLRDNDQTLWFTGHSLGGALAMLASARIFFEDPALLPDGVYTFGQPRTCDRLLADPYSKALASRVFRFVNNNDIVPQLPPEPVFHHVHDVRYFDNSGAMHEKVSVVSGLADKFTGFTSDVFAPAADGIRDHQIDRYLELIEKNLS
ncbi:lipase family protein [Saccharopolyspora sp. K220]|uniref:lipase family protein n=1 Tax=Saccharopolyspora soli TaxID=2926618 RepID=UPI001F5840ED|nr:lipase family protein [Saccharopolyspora soli]MCI2417953.1 lipase family protein [Saccharopolyspora soli]